MSKEVFKENAEALRFALITCDDPDCDPLFHLCDECRARREALIPFQRQSPDHFKG